MIKATVPAADRQGANLTDYEHASAGFTWENEARALGIPLSGPFNIYAAGIGRWAGDPERKAAPAVVCDSDCGFETVSFEGLDRTARMWAGSLVSEGLGPGDRVLVILPHGANALFAAAACAFTGAVFCPVFASSAYHEIEHIVKNLQPAAIVTRPELAEKIPSCRQTEGIRFFYTGNETPGAFPLERSIGTPGGTGSLSGAPAETTAESPLYIIHTSGSTRPPKGIVHVHGDALGILASARWALDLKDSDILFVDADPAWVTGTVYGAYAPWLAGIPTVVAPDAALASSFYRVIEKNRVTVLYTTPKRIRDLMEAGEDLPGRYDLSSLRHVASVGAPLVPDLFYWAKKNLGCGPHDTWWMTETGIICIANLRCCDIKPGSIGRPLPGIEAAVVGKDGERLPAMTLGELAIGGKWPGRMAAMFNDEQRFSESFAGGWFMTGDMAIVDEQGYFHHQGRTDDLIKAGGSRLIGPFEIERVLCSHPAVCEAAVIAKPAPPDTGVSTIKAFVVPKRGVLASKRLVYQLKAFLKGNLPDDVRVDEVALSDSLPKTRSGKLLRRVLRARELGLAPGETENLADL